jgi:hypothetical protein
LSISVSDQLNVFEKYLSECIFCIKVDHQHIISAIK